MFNISEYNAEIQSSCNYLSAAGFLEMKPSAGGMFGNNM
jgi:hypothetical protein